ncbi:hypothetical protein KLZ41_004607 [Salmonella enterica]|nr:hypothetical protein [Salmonella enterica]EGJ5696877.1 hypothetical protein [Salmonella enterica]EGL6533541.1 hypothetical protein [Salmonella enterica]EGT9276253.1 hypothetical protein [Salmonella enterica]EHO6105046.1 hypothetical protein [Salmonella enterica]
MKRLLCIAGVLFFSVSVLASGELEINDSPLTLILKDGNQARVSSCADFISLRKAGETIKELPNLSDPDYHAAKEALFSCWLQAYTLENSMISTKETKPSILEVLKHLPANKAYILSNEEHLNVEKKDASKTIFEYTPDLTLKGERAESPSRSTGYILDNYYSFVNYKGNKLNIISIIGYSIGGTASEKVFYRIDSSNNRIWTVTKLDENSPL